MASGVGRIRSLWRYPVRSMRGEELASAEVTSRGVLGDRCYCVVDVGEKRAAEASYAPLRWGGLVRGEAAFTAPPRASEATPPVRIRFADGSERASDETGISEWLSEQLGLSAALWRDGDAGGASISGARAEASGAANEIGPDEEPGDAPPRSYDRSPIHLVTSASLAHATSLHSAGQFDRARFRPNIVLDTGEAHGFIENDWIGRTLALGSELQIELVESCVRCVMTTLPQGKLERDPRILMTLNKNNSGHMGVYARVARPGTLRQGDGVELL